MTPQEKAKELIDKFANNCLLTQNGGKVAALITVNEMLDFRNGLYINEGSLAHKYLLDIKHEIEKL